MANTLKVTILQRGGMHGGRVVLEKAARFYVEKLFSPRLRNKLSLRIELRASKLGPDASGKAFSSCRLVARERREYTILVERDMYLNGQLEILAHEITHVEQYMRGRLKHTWKAGSRMVTKWLGQTMPEMPWDLRPWEIEAVAKARELYRAWREIERASWALKTGPKPLIDATPAEIEAYRTNGTIPQYETKEN